MRRFQFLTAACGLSLLAVVCSTPLRVDAKVPTPLKRYSFEQSLDDAIPHIREAQWSDEAIKPTTNTDGLSYVPGKVGEALHLNGDYGLKLDPEFTGETYSFGFWMRPEHADYASPTLMLTQTTFSAETFLNVTLSTGDYSPVAWTHCLWPEDVRYTTGLPAGYDIINKWSYLTVCVDGSKTPVEHHSELSFYMDGYLIATGNVPKELLVPGGSVWFGVNIWDRLFSGDVDEIVFFDTCLSESDVKDLYLAEGGDADAKNPLDQVGGSNWPWNPNWPWNDPPKEEPKGTITELDERLNTNFFLHLNVSAIPEDDNSSDLIQYSHPFATRKGKPISPWYCFGFGCLLLSGFIGFGIWKKQKQRF